MAAPTHSDIAPYPTGKFINGDFIGVRKFECADSDIPAILEHYDTAPNDLWPYNFGGWSTSAVAVEAKVEPKPKGKVTSSTSPLIDYDRAYITLTYATKPMFVLTDFRIWEELFEGVQQFGIPRPDNLLWASDSLPLMEGHGRVDLYRTGGTYLIHHFKLATAPLSVSTVWGKTNATSYTTASLGYTFGAGTMLCAGARVSRGSPGALTSSWKQARYKFLIRLEGWNNVYRTKTGTHEAVYLPDGSDYEPQGEATFTWNSLRV